MASAICLSNLRAAPEINLGDTTYVLSQAENSTYIYTPKEPKDAPAGSFTFVYNPEVRSSQALLDLTEGFRKSYAEAGKVIKQQKANNDDNEFLGYLVVAIFENPETQEHTAKMTRTTSTPEGGVAITYERTFEGDNSFEDMIAWFKESGRAQEMALLTMNPPFESDLKAK